MKRAIVIITADILADARGLLQSAPFSQTPAEAASTFVPAGSATGAAPATHYWCSTDMTPESWAACQHLCDQMAWAECFEYDLAANPNFPGLKLAEMGLQPLKVSIKRKTTTKNAA